MFAPSGSFQLVELCSDTRHVTTRPSSIRCFPSVRLSELPSVQLFLDIPDVPPRSVLTACASSSVLWMAAVYREKKNAAGSPPSAYQMASGVCHGHLGRERERERQTYRQRQRQREGKLTLIFLRDAVGLV